MQHRLTTLAPCLRSYVHCALLMLGVGLLQSPTHALATTKATPSGVYSDNTSHKHVWEVNAVHTLLWDGAPYIPVGKVFSPHSLSESAPSAWPEDRKALDALKATGLRDLVIWPSKSLSSVSPEDLQRLVTYLDANDFRYGLEFGPGLMTPLSGTVVKPGSYRLEREDQFAAQWRVFHSDRALLALAELSTSNNNIVENGVQNVPVSDGYASVSINSPVAGRVVALLYPHKIQPATGDGVLPDIWQGYDAYRDGLLAVLSKIKFGAGLRFFLDPLARHIGLSGEIENLVPDSTAFRLEWESFLLRHYTGPEEIVKAWGITENKSQSVGDLTNLLPFWANSRGVDYFYDPISRKTLRVFNSGQSRWWQDFTQCRNECIQVALNSLADVLKKKIADVPVVVSWTQTHPIFWNHDRTGGFDGLSISVPAGDPALLAGVLGPAYSEAEQAERTLWCLATEVVASPVAVTPHVQAASVLRGETDDSNSRQTDPYPNRLALINDFDRMRQAGLKGFFAGGQSARLTDQAPLLSTWADAPEAQAWLHDFSNQLGSAQNQASYAPALLFFPLESPGPAHVGLVPGTNNTLWLSSYQRGDVLNWWPSYSGYTLQEDDEIETTVLVSLQGKRKTHFQVVDAKKVQAFAPDGAPIPIRVLAPNRFEITMDVTPTVFKAGGQRLIPEEAAYDIQGQLSGLYLLATSQKTLGRDEARTVIDKLIFYLDRKDFDSAYTQGLIALDELTGFVKPYVWMEGESPRSHTFTEVAVNKEASNSDYLRLSTSTPPSSDGYKSEYIFQVAADGRYTIWLAGTYPSPLISPIKWGINTPADQTPVDSEPQGPRYLAERMGWIRLGSVNIKKGESQNLTIQVVGPAAATGDYTFSIDAIFITAYPFHPSGPVRPTPIDPSDAAKLRLEKLENQPDKKGRINRK